MDLPVPGYPWWILVTQTHYHHWAKFEQNPERNLPALEPPAELQSQNEGRTSGEVHPYSALPDYYFWSDTCSIKKSLFRGLILVNCSTPGTCKSRWFFKLKLQFGLRS